MSFLRRRNIENLAISNYGALCTLIIFVELLTRSQTYRKTDKAQWAKMITCHWDADPTSTNLASLNACLTGRFAIMLKSQCAQCLPSIDHKWLTLILDFLVEEWLSFVHNIMPLCLPFLSSFFLAFSKFLLFRTDLSLLILFGTAERAAAGTVDEAAATTAGKAATAAANATT